MRLLLALMSVAALAPIARAQQPSPASQTPPAAKLFTSAGDVTALIAKAKSERRPDQANFAQPLLRLAPYNVSLEYRVGSLNAPASLHQKNAEMFYVVDGSGTLVTGGTLRDERRPNSDNLSGSAIDGGTRQRVSKGDFVMVPENTPHWFSEIDGALVLMSMYLPRASSGTTP
jgi:mannose-6-phosphate isomerase-like protein (cupin superfamily)